jgi:hypothetical protein
MSSFDSVNTAGFTTGGVGIKSVFMLGILFLMKSE